MHRCCRGSQAHVMGTCTCPMFYTDHDMYSSVDCTLSLATPSTRLTTQPPSSLTWDILQSKYYNTQSQTNTNTSNHPVFPRRCANCDTTSTPLWRNGPRGPKSLCNACGIRFKKAERRASTAAARSAAVPGGLMESARAYRHHNHSWYAHSKSTKISNELRFMDDSDRDSENNGIPFLSWKLNVPDRTNLVHNYTR